MKEILKNNYKKMWNLSISEKINLDHQIYISFLETIKNTNIKNYVFIYWPRENEPETIAIIDELLKRKFKVCLMRINADGTKNFIPITSLDFEYEYFKNIKMPLKTKKEVTINEIDLIIVPTILFDSKNRVFPHQSLKIFLEPFLKRRIFRLGLGYEFCRIDEVLKNDYNNFDRIITDKKGS